MTSAGFHATIFIKDKKGGSEDGRTNANPAGFPGSVGSG